MKPTRLTVTSPGIGSGRACPYPSMLSSYLDGTLDPAERGRMEDHISRCEECYFVVRETALTWSQQAPAPGLEQIQTTQSASRAPSRLSTVRRYLLPVAAALVVGAGSLAFWRQVHLADAYVDAVRPLVEAVGERRFFEPRLTGGFKYGPRVSIKRSNSAGPDSGSWGMLAAAGELRARPAGSSPAARGGQAAAALFAGDVDAAVRAFEELRRDDPMNAAWPSNLAAALLVRAEGESGASDRRDQTARAALDQAEAALRLDPSLPEARFNRGLALKMLGRSEEARHWFAEIEGQGGPWRDAARDEFRDLSEAPKPRP